LIINFSRGSIITSPFLVIAVLCITLIDVNKIEARTMDPISKRGEDRMGRRINPHPPLKLEKGFVYQDDELETGDLDIDVERGGSRRRGNALLRELYRPSKTLILYNDNHVRRW
jgi:hypothetical protein